MVKLFSLVGVILGVIVLGSYNILESIRQVSEGWQCIAELFWVEMSFWPNACM